MYNSTLVVKNKHMTFYCKKLDMAVINNY